MTNISHTHILSTLEKEIGRPIRVSELLARYTTFKVGGPADFFVEVTNQKELESAVCTARNIGIPVTILGGGSNILIRDGGIRGLVIKNSARAIQIKNVLGGRVGREVKKRVFVEAESGALFNSLVRYTAEEGLSGLEMHLGLPGTVGGAIYMNSKWTKPESYAGDVLHSARLLKSDNTVIEVPKTYFSFGYDYSILQQSKDIVLSAIFELQSDTKERVWERANASIAHRRQSQPQGVKSAGCVFKNISLEEAKRCATPQNTVSAGYIIDSIGLKGTKVGGACISSDHANFIINLGQATARDVLQLIENVKVKVQSRYGLNLELEIQVIGEA